MPTATLSDSILSINGTPVFSGVSEHLLLESESVVEGAFIRFKPSSGKQRHEITLGVPLELERFIACHRYEPFWMQPKAGAAAAEVPVETQSLIYRRSDGLCVLVIPLCEQPLRSSVQGKGDGLLVIAETGDAHVPSSEALSLFVALVSDVYAAIPAAAAAVSKRLGTGALRKDKVLPAFIDVFGWCTWDAFYQDVSQPKVREGLESFRAAGIPPRSLILDDGWQRERTMPTGERRLTGFPANEKFPGDLSTTVQMAKGEFGIETFLVWHAVIGYWGGVDGEALPGYGVRDVARRGNKGMGEVAGWVPDAWGHLAGVVAPDRIAAFYNDYHAHLRGQGVDGVKVDNQAMLETVSDGGGGRVAVTQAYRVGLEASTHAHFDDRLINCMSCATETWYQSKTSNIIRTSTDFWPNKPESHGLHLYTNAQVCLWFSEFLHADWDMFQSGHPMGAYHAAGRAVSGAPIYVSDKPGAHDAALLRKLVLSDGSVLRCLDIGRPTPDCLFRDPTREPVLLKIFNRTAHGWVVGAFNARYHANERDRMAVAGKVSPADIPGIVGDDFVGYAHQSRLVMRLSREARLSLTLGELSHEVVTVVAVHDGCAVIGLADRFNASAAIAKQSRKGRTVSVELRDGGDFVAWCAVEPRAVRVDGKASAVTFDAGRGALNVVVPVGGAHSIEIELA